MTRMLRLLSHLLLLVYVIVLIKFVVFKDMDMILVGRMRFYFGGIQTGPGNWVPFQTIFGYFLGNKGMLIAGLNLVGNLALLFPLGFLLPNRFPQLRRNQVFILALFVSLSIEFAQLQLRVGIFDVDDIILNSIGLVLGYYFHRLIPHKFILPFTLAFGILLVGCLVYYLSHSVPMTEPVP